MPLTTSAVAGPDRAGSGRGVPVPSITICVLAAGRVRALCRGLEAMHSIDLDIGARDHVSPSLGGVLEENGGFLPAAGLSPGVRGRAPLPHLRRPLSVGRFPRLRAA